MTLVKLFWRKQNWLRNKGQNGMKGVLPNWRIQKRYPYIGAEGKYKTTKILKAKGCTKMSKYEFNATNLIAETFEKRDVKFDVVSHHDSEQLLAGFSVDCGPNVIMRFISRDNDNDVAARIFGLITNTPKEKRSRVMEACNVLNHKIRYMKFYLDTDGDINVEYDFPVRSPDNGIGEMAFEIFVRMMKILDSEYSIFMKALYSEEELDIQGHSIPAELMQRLQELRKMMEARMNATGASDDKESDGESDDVELDLEDLELVGSPDDTAC